MQLPKKQPEYKGWTFITASEFLGTKSPKPKKEKQEVFINKFYPGEKVWFYDDYRKELVQSEIESISKVGYYFEWGDMIDCNHKILQENQLYKTKSQLIKSLSKQWRQEVEDRILLLTK